MVPFCVGNNFKIKVNVEHACQSHDYDVTIWIHMRIYTVYQNKKLGCRTEIARCFVSFNVSLSHSRSLKVSRDFSYLLAFYASVTESPSAYCHKVWYCKN